MFSKVTQSIKAVFGLGAQNHEVVSHRDLLPIEVLMRNTKHIECPFHDEILLSLKNGDLKAIDEIQQRPEYVAYVKKIEPDIHNFLKSVHVSIQEAADGHVTPYKFG